MLADRSISPTVLADLIDNLPLDAALWRAGNPDAMWSLTDLLLAHIADLLAMGNWQRGGDPNARRPTPLPRPGVEAPEGEHVTGDLMTLDEAAEWLGWDH